MNRTVGIRGAGVAGLSLARELLKRDSSLSITIFDTRTRLPYPERTFSFFQFPEDNLPVTPHYSWPSVRFSGAGFERKLEVIRSPYVMIHGDRFFSESLESLQAAGVKFVWECPRVDISENTITAPAIGTVTFDIVIDAAFSNDVAQAALWQSFAGLWVTTETDQFDPYAAILMDLGPSCAHSPISFMYILPTSSKTALVEHTTFSIKPQNPDWHLEQCRQWLKSKTAGRYEVTGQERGCIPMGSASYLQHCDLRIGSGAGAIRPSTGYAFLSIQEQARSLSDKITQQSRVRPQLTGPYPWWMTIGDFIFIRALIGSPHKGADLLGGLLERAKPESLVRFLAGKASLTEAVSVWWSVPKTKMLHALLFKETETRCMPELSKRHVSQEGQF